MAHLRGREGRSDEGKNHAWDEGGAKRGQRRFEDSVPRLLHPGFFAMKP